MLQSTSAAADTSTGIDGIGGWKMTDPIIIELFPGAPSAEGCCDSNAAGEEGCCTPSSDALSNYEEWKKDLKKLYHEKINVLVYDYTLPLDRALAKRKLAALFKKRGFAHIKEEQIIQLATPSVAINGELISLGAVLPVDQIKKSLAALDLEVQFSS